jgi:hypothetical protein
MPLRAGSLALGERSMPSGCRCLSFTKRAATTAAAPCLSVRTGRCSPCVGKLSSKRASEWICYHSSDLSRDINGNLGTSGSVVSGASGSAASGTSGSAVSGTSGSAVSGAS